MKKGGAATATGAAAPMAAACGASTRSATTAAANASAPSATNRSRPASAWIPSAPTAVVTTGTPAAIASHTFPFIPAPKRRGATTALASA